MRFQCADSLVSCGQRADSYKKCALWKVLSCVLNAIILFVFISSFLGSNMGNSYIFHFIRLFTSKIIQCKVVCQTFTKIGIEHTCCTWNLENVTAQTRTQFPMLIFLSSRELTPSAFPLVTLRIQRGDWVDVWLFLRLVHYGHWLFAPQPSS